MEVHKRYLDVSILPETEAERELIIKWAKEAKIYNTLGFVVHLANVEGHPWYGKVFYELPLGAHNYSKFLEWLEANQREI